MDAPGINTACDGRDVNVPRLAAQFLVRQAAWLHESFVSDLAG